MIKIGIYGYGNLGKGVELAVRQASDMSLTGIFSRRSPDTVETLTGARIFPAADVLQYKDEIDVLIICGGSATDLPVMTPSLAKHFNVVDSFDTHAKIPEHFNCVDESARDTQHTALISGGWDPGLFSMMRALSSSILPGSQSYTFWGRGVSQGHSDAVRRIPGVVDARQYTVPIEEAVTRVQSGEHPVFTPGQAHTRECYVVAEDGADLASIEKSIVTMPNYFLGYDTTVHFISGEEMIQKHSGMPHGGMVIASGSTGISEEHPQKIEFRLSLDSNPEFTSSILVALARAVVKMNQRKEFGCRTIFDVTISDLSPLLPDELRKML